jgi:hypothetical protein
MGASKFHHLCCKRAEIHLLVNHPYVVHCDIYLTDLCSLSLNHVFVNDHWEIILLSHHDGLVLQDGEDMGNCCLVNEWLSGHSSI